MKSKLKSGFYQKFSNDLTPKEIASLFSKSVKQTIKENLLKSRKLVIEYIQFGNDRDDFVRSLSTGIARFSVFKVPRIAAKYLLSKK